MESQSTIDIKAGIQTLTSDAAYSKVQRGLTLGSRTDAIALYRGIDKEILVDRIIEKAKLFAQISGATFGRRQGLEDRLQKAKTVDDVKAITVDYSDISSQIPDDIWQYN